MKITMKNWIFVLREWNDQNNIFIVQKNYKILRLSDTLGAVLKFFEIFWKFEVYFISRLL